MALVAVGQKVKPLVERLERKTRSLCTWERLRMSEIQMSLAVAASMEEWALSFWSLPNLLSILAILLGSYSLINS